MPIREYTAVDASKGCEVCRGVFDVNESIRSELLTQCPHCGARLRRVYSVPQITHSTKLDDRARKAGFHKLKKVGQGNYHKEY